MKYYFQKKLWCGFDGFQFKGSNQLATDFAFLCFNIFPVASKGKALKEEWISYICHEVLNVSLQENNLFSNSSVIIIVNVCMVVKFSYIQWFLDNKSSPSTYSLHHRMCGIRGYMHELFVSKTTSPYNSVQSTFYDVSCLLHVTREFSLKYFSKHKLKTKTHALGAENWR